MEEEPIIRVIGIDVEHLEDSVDAIGDRVAVKVDEAARLAERALTIKEGLKCMDERVALRGPERVQGLKDRLYGVTRCVGGVPLNECSA